MEHVTEGVDVRALGCGNDVSVELSDVGRGWRAGPHAIRPRRRAAALFTALSDPSCWEHIPRPIPSNASELRDQIAAKLDGHRLTFTIRIDEQVIGTTSIIDVDDPQGVEIGATQLSTGAWGTGVNRRVKRLLIAALFASGCNWVQFRMDERNVRSAAAIRFLGAEDLGIRQDTIIRRDGCTRSSAFFRLHRPT